MKRTITIIATLDLDENYHGRVITPKEIARELVEDDVMELFEYEEGFRGLTVEVVDEEKTWVQCVADRYGATCYDFMTAERIR